MRLLLLMMIMVNMLDRPHHVIRRGPRPVTGGVGTGDGDGLIGTGGGGGGLGKGDEAAAGGDNRVRNSLGRRRG